MTVHLRGNAAGTAAWRAGPARATPKSKKSLWYVVSAARQRRACGV